MAKPRVKKEAAVSKKPTAAKAPAKSADLPDVVSMTTDEEDDQEIVNILGKIGSGKTFSAASASQFRKVLDGPEKKMTDLEDMLWVEADAKPCAGFRHNNLKVRRINLVAEMARTGKDIHYVLKKTLEAIAELWAPELRVVVDTLTGLDMLFMGNNVKKYRHHPNHYEMYKQNMADHLEFYPALKALSCHLIFCCHGKAWSGDNDKAMAVQLTGGGQMVPDITGASGKFYKRDETLQCGVVVRKHPKTKKTTRTILFGAEADAENIEGKNRYEGLLPDRMSPPHLAEALRLIRGGK